MAVPVRLIISLLGPPNVGKSTLSTALSAEFEAQVVRPRDAMRQVVDARPGLAELFSPVDSLGWASDYALAYALRVAIDSAPSGRAVLLENLPWDALQFLDLYHRTVNSAVDLVVLLVDAGDDVLMARGAGRRVCQACEHDPGGLPRRPARPAAGDADRCAVCGGALSTRPDDSVEILGERIRRSRRYLADITRYAAVVGVPIHRLDGTLDPADLGRAAMAVIRHARSTPDPVTRKEAM
jgi:adenylate kinase